ncbi:MAG: HesA/MoeB/ThiF family protein [Bacteroidales bacterium]|nr:HesA/MoeB/ThiF family protein [Bacteroidales bacterium]MBN2633720.1 HesA/MoeB/ThiF family protein [Bacteroidales bacterium]
MEDNDDFLSRRELRRYSKQIMIPEIGLEGQKKIRKASVMVIGAGGLGSPVLQYLVAAGIGKIGIVDFDMVSEENLQRQILYGADDVGKLKAVIAGKRLEKLNSFVNIEILNIKVGRDNALRLFRDYDIIIDATDNLEARYVINDACVILDKPMIHGAIYKFEAQVAVFNYRGGPTYRCFNPFREKKDSLDPAPSEVGILNVLPGIAGTCMACEAVKVITGTGEIFSGKVLMINIYKNTYRLFSVKADPQNRLIKEISDTEIIKS